MMIVGWWLMLTVLGITVWPLAARLFPYGDHGYLWSKVLGLAGLSLSSFLLASLRVLPFTRLSLLLLLVLLALLSWGVSSARRQNILQLLRSPRTVRLILLEEAGFLACLLIWTFARGLKPELDSLEKMMNIGFMMSLWRSDFMPAVDMWFAGGSINYYYFGQYAMTALAKLSNIVPAISYNLGMSTLFATTAGLSFSFGFQLFSGVRHLKSPSAARTSANVQPAAAKPEVGAPLSFGSAAPWLAGLLSSVLVTLGGNGHAILYHIKSPLHGLLKWLEQKGVATSSGLTSFWFSDSTRFIGYNPDIPDKTIHEFPYYSFLVADLHAHLINLTFVLLLLGLLFRILTHPALQRQADTLHLFGLQASSAQQHPLRHIRPPRYRTSWLYFLRATLGQPLIWCVGALLAIFMMGNYWDLIIYFAVFSLVLWFASADTQLPFFCLRDLPVVLIQIATIGIPFLALGNPLLAVLAYAVAALLCHAAAVRFPSGLTVAVAQASTVFGLAHLLALPFNLNFEPIAKSIRLTETRTSAWQFLVLWGVLILATLLVQLPQWLTRLRSGRPLAPLDRLLLALFLSGVGLLIIPELVYVVDIYGGEFKRANTMFKFTYQGFVLLMLVWASGLTRLITARWRPRVQTSPDDPGPEPDPDLGPDLGSGTETALSTVRRRPLGRQLLAGFVALLMVVPLWYPAVATTQWLGPWSFANYQGLDGTQPLRSKDSVQIPGDQAQELAADFAAIDWFNQEVEGQPVIVEAFGDSYTDYCRISAFTGLPTIIGWQTHEWLWRTSEAHPEAYADIVLPRQEDVRSIYTSADRDEVLQLLARYQVRYLILGDLEREQFGIDPWQNPAQEALLLSLGPIVFSSENLYVVEIGAQSETAPS